jgi:hypothetical protein
VVAPGCGIEAACKSAIAAKLFAKSAADKIQTGKHWSEKGRFAGCAAGTGWHFAKAGAEKLGRCIEHDMRGALKTAKSRLLPWVRKSSLRVERNGRAYRR